MEILESVVAQHAEEAAFLWLLRDQAVRAPHYDLDDLARLDDRLEAQVDGLRVADSAGWALAQDQLEQFAEAGETFAAGVLALESRDRQRIESVLTVVETEPEAMRGLISALGWVGREALKGTGLRLLNGGSAFLRRLGISACAVQRVDPGEVLDRAIADDDPAPRARALRTAGLLGRIDLLPALLEHLGDANGRCAFRAAWSAVRLGDREAALERLTLLAVSNSPFQTEAADLVLRVLEGKEAHQLIASQSGNPERRRAMIQAVGASGEPNYVPWLIEQMAAADLARPAGEAFAMITGADIAHEDLEGQEPESFEAGPSEDAEDEDVALDQDEDLPWPGPESIEAWWSEHGGRFQAGTRCLAGAPITAENCREVLRTGLQRQRRAAALELALREPGQPLFEIRAPGFRQQKLLGLKG